MSEKQAVIYRYIRTHFKMDKIRVLLVSENQYRINSDVETLILTCDDQFNIIDVASGEIIARKTLNGWQDVPGSFWKRIGGVRVGKMLCV